MPEGTPGAFWVTGRLFDGHGEPVPDGLIETWQADPDGRFDHPDDPRKPHDDVTSLRRASADSES